MDKAAPGDPLPEGSTLAGRFRIVQLIGRTATGAVYAASDARRDGEAVALKVIYPSYLEAVGEGLLRRFVREAHVSAALPSPHIVPALSGGIDPATRIPYVVMPLLEGRDLDRWLREAAPLEPPVAVRIAIQVGLGLRLAHEYGIVHRDIKPSNIMLEERPDQVVARVSDFGVAKIKPVDEQHITRTGTLLGSPVYMAPEQLLRPHDVDPRADVWSLAMTLYHALTGQAPLEKAKNFTELVLALTQRDLPPLQDLAPWVDPGLARVVHGALVRDLDARCPSIDAFLEALEPFAGATTRLTLADLVPASGSTRAIRAVRAELPGRWEAPRSASEVAPPPPTVAHESSLVGHTVGGRFRLDAVLRQSPTATFYEATDDRTGPCVVKVYRSEATADTEHLERFASLLTKVRGLSSEHITRLIDLGNDDATHLFFVAYERLRGVDLGHHIRQSGALDPAAVARIMVQACRGLTVAHSAGVAHQNLKPSNLFLHETDEGKLITKLCDFGHPCPLEHADGDDGPAFSVAGQFALSPMYLSPEQVAGKPATFRSDTWSLAVVLYEALSGKKPWQGFHSLGELLAAIQNEEIRPIREVAPWVEGGLAEVVHGGLRRDPAQRYASVNDMLVALGPFAATVRSLQRGSIGAAPRPSVVIHRDRAASALDKTELADSGTSKAPSRPPPAPQRTDTLISGGTPQPRQATAAIFFAIFAAVLLVGLGALALTR